MAVHLHVHSYYSLLNAVPEPKDIVKKAKALDMTAVGITDYGALYGCLEFYLAAKAAEIKPIIGVSAFLTEAEDISIKEQGDLRHQIILIAKNNTGYFNLVKMMSKASLEGFYYVPRIDRKMLREHSEGLIALSGTISGEIPRLIQVGKSEEEILAKIRWYQEIFGEDFYLEISHHPEVENFKEITETLIEISDKYNIPKVASQQVFYLEKKHQEAHDILLCIRDDKTVDDPSRFSVRSGDYSFLSNEEMAELFKNTPDAIENTHKIADSCNLDLIKKGWVFPNVKIRDDCKDAEEMMEKETFEGIEKRLGRKPDQSETDRLNYELEIIKTKGFTTYILLCKQITDYMKAEKIANSTRGSAAGSFVTYALGITRANPLYFDLPFERFLNPLRPKAPDIDLDIEDRRRGDMIAWTRNTFGFDNVAQIITFGTLSAKNAIKDVARAFKRPFSETNELTKLIPVKWGKTDLGSALKEVPQLKEMYESDPVYKKIFDIALVLEGCPRHSSVHAAGVVITPEKLTNYVPLARDPRSEMPVTQYDMNRLEDLGLLKMDYLGLRNLSVIADCIEAIEKRRGVKVDIENIPLDDKETFRLMSEGHTFGLFQLEGLGMTRYLRELKPTTIFDIQAMVALFRPGPLENIPEYIARKRDPAKIAYLHPDLEPILERTFGVIVYQDDVLLTAIKMAGYNWADADRFRKGMGKKIPEVIQAERDTFIKGCIANGHSEELAVKMFDLFAPFAGYGFNKAHAAAYSLIAYQTAYLKANFTIEYMAALLQAEASDIEKTTANIIECEHMGITILPPDINESYTNFTALDNKTIRFGLQAIKGLGIDTVKNIIHERKARGQYKSISDFLERVTGHSINRKSLEALTMSGAFDTIAERNSLLHNVETLLAYSKSCQDESETGQTTLFDNSSEVDTPTLTLEEAAPAGFLQKLEWEKDILGLYISGHPLDGLKNYLRKKGLLYEKFTPKIANTRITCVGLIRNLRFMKTKQNENMAGFILEDPTGEINCIMFPKYLSPYLDNIKDGRLCSITGTLQYRPSDGSYTIRCQEMAFMNLEKVITAAKSSGLFSDSWKVSEIRRKVQAEKMSHAEPVPIQDSVSDQVNDVTQRGDPTEIIGEDMPITKNSKFFEIRSIDKTHTIILSADTGRDDLLEIKNLLDAQPDGDNHVFIQVAQTKIPYNRPIILDEYFEQDLGGFLIQPQSDIFSMTEIRCI